MLVQIIILEVKFVFSVGVGVEPKTLRIQGNHNNNRNIFKCKFSNVHKKNHKLNLPSLGFSSQGFLSGLEILNAGKYQ